MNRKFWDLILCLFLGLVLVGAARCWSQTGAGNIQGTVSDATGAVVPGAKVTLVQTQTSLQYNTTTNSAGFYVFPSVLLGPYKVTVEASGMQTYTAELTLQAGQTAEVNATLAIGSTTTQVTVEANVTPLVNTTDATLSNVIEHSRIEQLPVDGRNVQTLVIQTTPGVTSFNGKVPTVNGVLYGSNFTQDGALLENRDWQRLPDRLPGLDTIEEFRVDTSNASAETERPGTVTLTTRHGTNQLHGSIFETNRDSAYGVARKREDISQTKTPHYVRNEFGGNLGGPIDIPKVYNGKDRTFFFFAYELYRRRQAVPGAATVPTAAMRNGDFSGCEFSADCKLLNSDGLPITLYNPYTSTSAPSWTRQTFSPNNVIPQNLESPLAQYLWSHTPMPTLPGVNPLVDNNWYGLGTENQNQTTTTLRLDHQLSQNDQVSFRYTHGTNTEIVYNNGLSGALSPSTTDGFFNVYAPSGHNDTGVVGWNHTYSATFFGETRFTYARDYHIEGPGTGIENIASKLGLPNPFNAGTPPDIVDVGFFNYQCGCYLNRAWARVMDFHEKLTKTIGRHELFFGGTLQYEHDSTLPDQQYESGLEDFDSLATAAYDTNSGSAYSPKERTGFQAANLFLGVGTYLAYANRQTYRNYVSEKALYIQDNFKVNPRLTLNLGARWEYNSPAHLSDDSLVGFDPALHAVVLQTSIENLTRLGDVVPQIAQGYANLGVKYETPAQAGLADIVGAGKNLVYSNYHDVSPRLGFAYRLTQGSHYSVLRGGYGRYYYPDSLRLWNGNNQFTVPTFGQLQNNPNSGLQSPDGNRNYLLRAAPTVIAGKNSQDALTLDQATGILPGSGTVYWLDPHSPTTHADMWNLTYQKEIGANTALSLSYVGTHGENSPQYYSINDVPSELAWYLNTGLPLPASSIDQQPFDPVFGTVQEYRKTGWSNDNSFQVQLQHQYSKGYAFQVFYVFSNAFRAGGDGWRRGGVDSTTVYDYVFSPNLFPPGTLPSDYHAANRLLNYQRDTSIPKHNIKWNWLAELPFGRGKRIGGNANGFLNAFIGGWQFSGSGNWFSRYFTLPNGLYGDFNGVEGIGKNYKIQDCRSGQCVNGVLWWNGYIPANQVNKPGGIQGLPSNYKPFQTPLIPTPTDGVSAGDPLANYYESNSVCVNLAAKTYQVLTANSPCLSGAPGYQLTSARLGMPWPLNSWNPQASNKHFPGPNEWDMDASLFKEFAMGERMRLRFQTDFFNVFNRPGTTMPSSRGIITKQFSDNSPRLLQMTLRLSW